jgi:uncharacterized RDD family membrane protein YckC
MEIWLIQNGKKVGPLQDYEVRSRIESDQLQQDHFAWHEGLPKWVRLGEIEIFKSDFEKNAEAILVPNEDELSQARVVISVPGKAYLLRRFWARWLDMSLYAAAWWLLMYAVGRDIGAMITDLWIVLTIFIPWFVIESWLLHWFGTTPGKWLLGIRVLNEDESKISLKASIWRSIRVMIAGVGFGWGMLAMICQVMSWFTTRRMGKPIWDYMGQHKVVVKPLGVFRVIAVVILFFVSMQLQVAVRGPHEQKLIVEQYPEMRDFFEQGKVWHLPVKDDQ